MKTMKETIALSSIPPRLFRATIRQFGTWADFKETARDISSHGAQNGFSGFIYYPDTTKFFDRNRPQIVDVIYKIIDEQGMSFSNWIQFIPVLRDYGVDCRSILHGHEMGRYMPEDDIDRVKCVFTWIVLEAVAFDTAEAQERAS